MITQDLLVEVFETSSAVSQATLVTLSTHINLYLVQSIPDKGLLGLFVTSVLILLIVFNHSQNNTLITNIVMFCAVNYFVSISMPINVNLQEQLGVVATQIFLLGILCDSLLDTALQHLGQALTANSRYVFANTLSKMILTENHSETAFLLTVTLTVILSTTHSNMFTQIIQMATSNVMKQILLKNIPVALSIPTNLAIVTFVRPLLHIQLVSSAQVYDFLLYKVAEDINTYIQTTFYTFVPLVIFVIVSVLAPTITIKSVAQICVTSSVSHWILNLFWIKGKGDLVFTLLLFCTFFHTLTNKQT